MEWKYCGTCGPLLNEPCALTGVKGPGHVVCADMHSMHNLLLLLLLVRTHTQTHACTHAHTRTRAHTHTHLEAEVIEIMDGCDEVL